MSERTDNATTDDLKLTTWTGVYTTHGGEWYDRRHSGEKKHRNGKLGYDTRGGVKRGEGPEESALLPEPPPPGDNPKEKRFYNAGAAVSRKSIRLAGAAIALIALVPAGGPVFLGIIRDDVHAHSRTGDLGLQAITVSGLLLFGLGILLILRAGASSGKESPETKLPTSRR